MPIIGPREPARTILRKIVPITDPFIIVFDPSALYFNDFVIRLSAICFYTLLIRVW